MDSVAWLCEAAQATMLRWLVTPLFSMARLVLVTRPSTTATHMVATLLGLVMLCRVVSCPVRIYYRYRGKHVKVMFEVHASASAFFKNLLRHHIDIINIKHVLNNRCIYLKLGHGMLFPQDLYFLRVSAYQTCV